MASNTLALSPRDALVLAARWIVKIDKQAFDLHMRASQLAGPQRSRTSQDGKASENKTRPWKMSLMQSCGGDKFRKRKVGSHLVPYLQIWTQVFPDIFEIPNFSVDI